MPTRGCPPTSSPSSGSNGVRTSSLPPRAPSWSGGCPDSPANLRTKPITEVLLTVNPKGQVTIPEPLPDHYGFPLGTKVLWLDGEEPRWAEVEEILPTGELWMTLVHLGEVTCILGRTSDARAASVLDCPVLTGDPEFRVAEETWVTVHWLGRRASRPSPDCGWSRRPTSTDLWRIRNPLGARGPTSATGLDCGARPRSPPGSRLHSAPSEPLPCHDTTRVLPASQAGVRRCPGGPCR